MQIRGVEFERISSWQSLTIPDSFVVPDNKVHSGHGEAKFYVGSKEDPNLRTFFGENNFVITAMFEQQDLVQFLEDIKNEYFNPSQPYINASDLRSLWFRRMKKIEELATHELTFECREQDAGGSRCYVKGSQDSLFQLLRELTLPNRTSVQIDKYCSEDAEEIFVFRLQHSLGSFEDLVIREASEVAYFGEDATISLETKRQLILSCFGLGQFRELLFASCEMKCPFTGIRDERLLTATHLKPWLHCNNEERLNPQNGVVLSGIHDQLLRQGLITFTDDGNTLISTSLTPAMTGDLEVSESPLFPLPFKGVDNMQRRKFLSYHRRNIFLP